LSSRVPELCENYLQHPLLDIPLSYSILNQLSINTGTCRKKENKKAFRRGEKLPYFFTIHYYLLPIYSRPQGISLSEGQFHEFRSEFFSQIPQGIYFVEKTHFCPVDKSGFFKVPVSVKCCCATWNNALSLGIVKYSAIAECEMKFATFA